MRIGLIQFDSGTNIQTNIETATKFIAESVENKCDIVCLPEIFLYEGKEDVYFAADGKEIKIFRNLAKKYKIMIILGSVLLENKNGTKTNTCFIIDKTGELLYRYDKIKMFKTFRSDYFFDESETTTPGKQVGVFEFNGIKIGVAICYDLRFPEIFREMLKQEVQLIFLPSCFRKATGWRAWKTLPEARAIENQVYFCACSQTGGKGVRQKCGNSKVIDFQGNVIAKIGRESGIVVADVDFNSQKEYRSQLPVLKDI